ncbi:MAG: hypothetical protein OEW84_07540, partial [Aigarchaeota archaeon]|nr:hypothetical protein [Aigarchaeota archaeon]
GSGVPWDHRRFRRSEVNMGIVEKLREVLDVHPAVPVVLETQEPLDAIQETINSLRSLVP